MYQHILIPTDGSALAERAVTHGLSLVKAVGAKVTTIVRSYGHAYTETWTAIPWERFALVIPS